jgi:hypothetical protein
MENIKLKKIVDELIVAKNKGTENNLLQVAGEIRRMVDNKISIASMIRALKQAGIKTSLKRLREFVKSLKERGE